MTQSPRLFKFRPMQPADIDMMLDWRAASHVARWFGPARDRARLELAYMEWMESDWYYPHVVMSGGRAIGFLGYYVAADAGDRLALADAEDLLGIDFFIGEPALLGRGLARPLISQAAAMLLREPAVVGLIADPAPDNEIARKALTAAGFAPIDGGRLFRLDRPRHKE